MLECTKKYRYIWDADVHDKHLCRRSHEVELLWFSVADPTPLTENGLFFMLYVKITACARKLLLLFGTSTNKWCFE